MFPGGSPGHFRCTFTADEDARLRDIVSQMNPPDWRRVALQMYSRTARQCRERWKNYINPTIKSIPWTLEEEAVLNEKFAEFGSKWQKIARFLPGRSSNSIKNHRLRWQRIKPRPGNSQPSVLADRDPFCEPISLDENSDNSCWENLVLDSFKFQ